MVLCACIAYEAWPAALAVFSVAALTDWLDGWWARRFGRGTTLGRSLDPLADKVLVGAAFIYLIPVAGAGVPPWMVTVVVCRELLVTGLRGVVEATGQKFGADWFGKLKTVLQCAVLIGVFAILSLRDRSWAADALPALEVVLSGPAVRDAGGDRRQHDAVRRQGGQAAAVTTAPRYNPEEEDHRMVTLFVAGQPVGTLADAEKLIPEFIARNYPIEFRDDSGDWSARSSRQRPTPAEPLVPWDPDHHPGRDGPAACRTRLDVRGGQEAAGLGMTYSVTWTLAAIQQTRPVDRGRGRPGSPFGQAAAFDRLRPSAIPATWAIPGRATPGSWYGTSSASTTTSMTRPLTRPVHVSSAPPVGIDRRYNLRHRPPRRRHPCPTSSASPSSAAG